MFIGVRTGTIKTRYCNSLHKHINNQYSRKAETVQVAEKRIPTYIIFSAKWSEWYSWFVRGDPDSR